MVKSRPMHRKNGVLLGEMMKQGYTIQSLANAIGVHYLTIWRVVNREHRPHHETAAKICELLQKTPRELDLKIWGKGGQDNDDANDAD